MYGCMKDRGENEDKELYEEQGRKGSEGRQSFHFPGRRCRRHTAIRLGKLSLEKDLTAELWATEGILCHSAMRETEECEYR